MTDREAWLKGRLLGIGGSDAPAVLGVSPYKSALELYFEKRGEVVPSDEESEPMRWGTLLEPAIRQEYAERTGEIVRVPSAQLSHPAHPWMIANVDGVTDSGKLLEIKTARTAEGWGEVGTGEVPEAYLVQVQHYLSVTALSAADVAVLIGGQDFRLYHVEADRELQGLIIDAEAEFWDHVQRAEPPEAKSYADLIALYGRSSKAATVTASALEEQCVQSLRMIGHDRALLDRAEEEARGVIMRRLGEADTLVDLRGRPLCTWRAAKPPVKVKLDALRMAHPLLVAQYEVTGAASRRFLLKGSQP